MTVIALEKAPSYQDSTSHTTYPRERASVLGILLREAVTGVHERKDGNELQVLILQHGADAGTSRDGRAGGGSTVHALREDLVVGQHSPGPCHAGSSSRVATGTRVPYPAYVGMGTGKPVGRWRDTAQLGPNLLPAV